MQTFQGITRVRVTAPGPLQGRTATVHRLCLSDNSAWLTCDEDIPAEMRSFQPPDPRRNNVRLYPEDCEPLK